ncbi:MAG: SDR family NAD(P)-dependent oxidoreductase [Methyloceanibacter sp.]|nr:SDR family NAD(P)-dependent oxidoreductase [Methyloceanibacter sp.]
MEKGSAIVVGAGSGTGAEVAKRFAEDGYAVAVVRRNADALASLVAKIEQSGGNAKALGADASDEAAVARLFEEVERTLGPVEVVVFNAASITRASILETTVDDFDLNWRSSALGGFLIGREAARRMETRGRGTILFTGATASIKASAGFAAFASGKHGLRAVAQSMARELGPKGIHVAHIILDGIIDVPRVHQMMPDRATGIGTDGLINAKSIAGAYLWVHNQPRDSWTFELDLRPSSEPW